MGGARAGPSSVDAIQLRFYPSREGIGPSLFFTCMKIRTLFFASYRDLLGARELILELREPFTVTHLVADLRSRGGAFSGLPPAPAVAVNEGYCGGDTLLRDGDVVAFIPPVAGG